MKSSSYKLPDWVTLGFKVAAHRWYVNEECPCWLAQFDPLGQPCEINARGLHEAFHFFGRQEIRDALWGAPEAWLGEMYFGSDPREEVIQLAEWDPRNGGVGCELHHRRFDSQLTPTLTVPAQALPLHVLRFAVDRGLESRGERRFPGGFEDVLSDRLPGIVLASP